MNCSRKIFFWNNSYFLEQLTDFSGTIHIFWHNWQIQGWQNMPFPKDLKTKHLGRLFLCQLEQFIYLLKNTILIGHDIILKNIYLTILPKNYFLEANFSNRWTKRWAGWSSLVLFHYMISTLFSTGIVFWFRSEFYEYWVRIVQPLILSKFECRTFYEYVIWHLGRTV